MNTAHSRSRILLTLSFSILLFLSGAHADPIDEIRDQYSKINTAPLKWVDLKPPFEEEFGASFKRGSLDGQVRKAVLNFDMGDHGGGTTEIYYNESGAPVFLFCTESSWQFNESTDEEPSTTDRVEETRIYFHQGKAIRALHKQYEFSKQDESAKAAAAAENQAITLGKHATRRLLTPLDELKSARPPKVVVLAEQLRRAHYLLREPDIPNDPGKWAPVEVPTKPLRQDKNLAPGDAAFGILLSLNIIQEGEDAEHPDFIDTDILEQTEDSATVVITLDGLRDDSIQAMRYRIELSQNLESWQLMAIGQQSKKWSSKEWTSP